jgi:polyhydroxyalkanoate synthase
MNLAMRGGRPMRTGPRPLALHLANSNLAWASSLAAWPLWKSGSLPWKASLADPAESLRQSLGAASADGFAPALERELRRRSDLFLKGVERYRRHPYRRAMPEMPPLWEEGTTRLLDYAPGGGAPVLVVPSLINRGYILDLAPGNSLLRHLAGQGLRPLLLDWGAPGAIEKKFDLTDYIAGRIERAAEVAAKSCGGKLAVLGYCMGGLLALALAQRRPDLVASLALLATPWAFHAERDHEARALGALAAPFAASFAATGEIPVDVLQALFTALNPLFATRKFSRFAEIDDDNAPAARAFVALEDWLNDGVPLALPAGLECLSQWYGADAPGRGEWRVAGRAVLPAELRQPSLVILPAQDRIVPPKSAAALAAALPHAEVLRPSLGHIGMVVGHEAPKEVWAPLGEWLSSVGNAKAS